MCVGVGAPLHSWPSCSEVELLSSRLHAGGFHRNTENLYFNEIINLSCRFLIASGDGWASLAGQGAWRDEQVSVVPYLDRSGSRESSEVSRTSFPSRRAIIYSFTFLTGASFPGSCGPKFRRLRPMMWAFLWRFRPIDAARRGRRWLDDSCWMSCPNKSNWMLELACRADSGADATTEAGSVAGSSKKDPNVFSLSVSS